MNSLAHRIGQSAIIGEIYARPYALVTVPAPVSLIALMLEDETADDVRRHSADLCRRTGVPASDSDSMHHLTEIGLLLIRWKQHAEFWS